MPISPEVQHAPRKIYMIAIGVASLLAANVFTLTVDAESHGEQTVIETTSRPHNQLGNLALETTTTLPPTTSVALSPEHPSRVRASRNSELRIVSPPTTLAPVTGTKAEWLAEAGVAVGDYNDIDYIFTRESHWNPDDVSGNKCIGLGQNCPDKDGHYWLVDACPNWQSDPVCQIRRFDVYAKGRWHGWQGAHYQKARYNWW